MQTAPEIAQSNMLHASLVSCVLRDTSNHRQATAAVDSQLAFHVLDDIETQIDALQVKVGSKTWIGQSAACLTFGSRWSHGGQKLLRVSLTFKPRCPFYLVVYMFIRHFQSC